MKKKFKNFLGKMKNYFTEKVTYYEQDKDGDFAILSASEYEKAKEMVKEFSKDIKELVKELDGDEKKIQESIELLGKMDFSKVPSDVLATLFAEAEKKVEESKSINIETPTIKTKRGGYMGVVSRTDKIEGKETNKSIGGIILSRKEESIEKIGGDYSKIDDVKEILDELLKDLEEVLEIDGDNEKLRKKITEKLTSINNEKREALKERIQKTAEEMPKETKVKKVEKHLGLKRAFMVATSLSCCAVMAITALSGLGKKIEIPVQPPQETVVMIEDYANKTLKETSDSITVNLSEMTGEISGTINEAQTIGLTEDELKSQGLDDINYDMAPEVNARIKLKNYNQHKKMLEEEIDEIKDNYKNIKNPTNQEYIEYIIKLYEKNINGIELNEEIIDVTNLYSEKWNEFNNEHIDQGMSDEHAEQHEEQNEFNSQIIDNNNEELDQLKEKKDECRKRIEFLNGIKSLNNLENIENIRRNIRRFI